MKLTKPPENPKRNVLLYGAPKAGKSAGATSAPGPLLALNADLPNATAFAHRLNEFDEIEYEGFSTLVEIAALANRNELAYETLIVDPVGELYRRVLAEFSKDAVSPTLPNYQATSVHLERFYRSLCECPSINVVFVAHELPVKDESTGTMERLPATGTTNPALGQKLMGMVDVIGYCGVVEKEGQDPAYIAQLITANGRRGGDRTASLGRVRELDLKEWFAVMANSNGGVTPQKEK